MRAQIHEHTSPRCEGRAGLLELPGFEIRRAGARDFTLQIWGPLEDPWAAALGVGLFEAGMRVVRGYGRRLDGPVWLGEFELEALDDSEDPVRIDYLALAREPVELLAPPLVTLSRFHRSLTSKHGGSLFLEVRARDRLGFLGGLLAPIARLGLVPEEFHIDTLGLPVLDRFFLKQQDGAAPGRDARRRLKGLLDQLSSPRTSAIE